MNAPLEDPRYGPMLLNVFQRHVREQCILVLIAADHLRKRIDPSDDHMWFGMQNLLTSTANLSKLLWGQGGKFTEERTLLRASLNIEDSSPFKPTTVRNSFEHYDERIDEWWATSTNHIMVDRFVGDVEEAFMGPAERDIFRAYDPWKGTIHFWGKVFDILPVVTEARRIIPIADREIAKWPQQRATGSE